MGRDVFLSYSSEDKTQADAVCAALEARGFSVWIAPRDIPPGANRAGSTAEAIGGAKALVLILSSAANNSAQVLREVQQAISREATVVPFQIEAIRPIRPWPIASARRNRSTPGARPRNHITRRWRMSCDESRGPIRRPARLRPTCRGAESLRPPESMMRFKVPNRVVASEARRSRAAAAALWPLDRRVATARRKTGVF